MGRKKQKNEDHDDDDYGKLTREQKIELERYYTDKMVEVAKALPWDKLILSGVFTYAWYKAYGGKRPTLQDLALGIYYGFTIPPALEGGIVANSYAVAALGYLGVGLAAPNIESDIEKATGEMKNIIDDAGDFAAKSAKAVWEAFWLNKNPLTNPVWQEQQP